MKPVNNMKGVVCSLLGSMLFGLLYYYYQFLPELAGGEIYSWRMIFSSIFLLLLFLNGKNRSDFIILMKRAKADKRVLAGMVLSSQLLAAQLWLFMWAPLNGYAMEVSAGYFLLPLTLALTGKLVFGERFGPFKTIAFLAAMAGFVAHTANGGGLSWPLLVVCLGYPVYYGLRRFMHSNNVAGFIIDILLNLPAAIVLLIHYGLPHQIADMRFLALLSGLGMLSILALLLMIVASQNLNLILFGLLNYVEPCLLVIVALLIGQPPSGESYVLYTGVLISVTLLIAEGGVYMLRNCRTKTDV
ncbi:EamA family transporter RarD [Enterobacter hormaechei]|uniref:EamA family transporter RarD n=1 Tax=Enterobacter hormaechei TaxID=158836 RepID=UPI0039BF19B2